MNLRLILIFLLSTVGMSSAQNCVFEIQNLSNTLNGEFKLIEKSEYENVKETQLESIQLTPASELNLIKKYPKIFKIKDSCYVFFANINNANRIKTTELKACKNRIQTKEYSDYEFKGIYFGNALIKITGYESWGYLSVDLRSGSTFYTMGKPLTLNGETAISYSNYYGEEEIAMTDLKTKKQYVIGIQGWRTKESRVYRNNYYLKLEPEFQTDCSKEIRYLKVGLKK